MVVKYRTAMLMPDSTMDWLYSATLITALSVPESTICVSAPRSSI